MTKRYGILAAGMGLLLVLSIAAPASAGDGWLRDHFAAHRAAHSSWHNDYYDPAWGTPVALVVPARVKAQTNYGVGVGQTSVTRVPHQFRPDGMEVVTPDGGAFAPMPAWPTNTNQLGVYYVRGPRP
jgi:hypothetical protein